VGGDTELVTQTFRVQYSKPKHTTRLTSDGNFIVALVAHRTLLLVGIVKRDADGRLRDARLAVLVHQLLKVGSSHLHNGKRKPTFTPS